MRLFQQTFTLCIYYTHDNYTGDQKEVYLNILELLESCSFYYAASQVSW